jgi:hypothetical protein
MSLRSFLERAVEDRNLGSHRLVNRGSLQIRWLRPHTISVLQNPEIFHESLILQY